ncbi:MAG: MarR family winged helix-turn-helix transcriptional regulator [Comamonas sp.]
MSSDPVSQETVCSQSLPLDEFLTFKLMALANALQMQVTRHYIAPVTSVGLVEWRLMGLLQQHGESHAGALARISLIDKAQISRSLQPLIEREWVQRRVDPQHARRHLLSLTPQGLIHFNCVLAQARPFQAALLNALTRQERESLNQIMAKLMQAAETIDAQASQQAADSEPNRLQALDL